MSRSPVEHAPEGTSDPASAPEGPPPSDVRQRSWGFPSFATDFPRDPELDALVDAFARGDYASVREGAPKLAAATTSEPVRSAALLLRERIEPEGSAKLVFVLAAALLVFLTGWWVAHDGAEGEAKPAPPTIESTR